MLDTLNMLDSLDSHKHT